MGATMTAVGLISGTSMDGIDVALLETDGQTVSRVGPAITVPYPEDVVTRLRAALAAPEDDHTDLEAAITDANADAVRDLLDANGLDAAGIDVVGFHGQTILHRPERHYTRQLGDGARLAQALGIAVVNDFRQADVAAGGQGAPFAPLYHRALAAGLEQPLAVLNLGGVGNVTYIDRNGVLAFDTGPASAMIDDWVLAMCGQPYDAGGALAATGTVQEAALEQFLSDPFFTLPPPKSLDRNDFSADPVEGLSPADGAATLTAFTAHSVAKARQHMPAAPRRWLVTGGGRHNATMMAMLRDVLGAPCVPVEDVGWQGDVLEAQAFAFLAVRSLRDLPLSLPSTTGVPEPMCGGVLHRA